MNCSNLLKENENKLSQHHLHMKQVIDIRDVSFQSLSKNKIVCAGAKPAAALVVPDKLLLLTPKVIYDFI